MPESKDIRPEPQLSLSTPGILYAMAIDESAGKVYVGGSEGTVYECDVNAATPTLRPRFFGDSYVSGLTVVRPESEGAQLIVARYDGTLCWFDLKEGKSLRTAKAHSGWIRDLAVARHGALLATVGHDMLVKLWDTRSGALVHSISGHAPLTPQGYVSALYAVAASPDGRFIASADRIGEVRVWDVENGRQAAHFVSRQFYTFDSEKRGRSIGGVRRLRFSPNGELLAVAGIGQVSNVDGFVGPCRLEVWDWQESRRIARLEDTHQAMLNDVLWSPDGGRLTAAGGGDGGGVLVVWTLDGKQPDHKVKFKGHTQRLAWLNGGERLLTAGFDGVQCWDTPGWLQSKTSG